MALDSTITNEGIEKGPFMARYTSNQSKPGTPGRSTQGSRSGYGRGGQPSRGGRSQGSKIADKKFDPSMFIKKPEEQVAEAVYVPKHTFQDFQIVAQVKANIAAKGYVQPTPIQDQAIPIILEGKDVLATANTGTGKTAAFLIPLLHRIMTQQTERVLVLAPTRELAAQIKDELVTFAQKLPIHAAVCIGGVNINPQISVLKRNPQFVIGTPGRLKDLEQQQALRFSSFSTIVLDEVDTMLDMGFLNDIKKILAQLPKKRQSLFFSATVSPEIKRIADTFQNDPVAISVKTRQSAANVNQDIVKIAGRNKIEVLHDLLLQPEFTKVIIFGRTKRSTEKLSRELRGRGFNVAAIHGDKSQAQRKKALQLFKDDQVKILLATDVVARGIDIDDVSHVINFDLPQTYEDYIHRIGRTGRASKVGQALTFID